ncbi:MAG TPA: hypothetical protein DEQ84_00335, partial [Prevotellaceae bacterium]|nr:hypothetical protein [Prevotellaceae bacterium]
FGADVYLYFLVVGLTHIIIGIVVYRANVRQKRERAKFQWQKDVGNLMSRQPNALTSPIYE